MTRINIRVDTSRVQALSQAPQRLKAAVGRWANQGGQLVRNAMRDEIRKRQQTYGRTGRLSNSIDARLAPGGFSVGPTASYALFVDQPTRPHLIRPRRAKALVFPGRGGGPARLGYSRSGKAFTVRRVGTREVRSQDVQFARVVRHPGTRGMFFIDRTTARIVDPLTRLLEAQLDAELSAMEKKA